MTQRMRLLSAASRHVKKQSARAALHRNAANGANEEAVRLFLEGRIPFLKIGELVEGVVDSEAFGGPYTLDDVYACDAAARICF